MRTAYPLLVDDLAAGRPVAGDWGAAHPAPAPLPSPPPAALLELLFTPSFYLEVLGGRVPDELRRGLAAVQRMPAAGGVGVAVSPQFLEDYAAFERGERVGQRPRPADYVPAPMADPAAACFCITVDVDELERALGGAFVEAQRVRLQPSVKRPAVLADPLAMPCTLDVVEAGGQALRLPVRLSRSLCAEDALRARWCTRRAWRVRAGAARSTRGWPRARRCCPPRPPPAPRPRRWCGGWSTCAAPWAARPSSPCSCGARCTTPWATR